MALSPRDRLWKLAYVVYYGWLYGRPAASWPWLRRGVRAFEARTGRGDAPQVPADWQEQWEVGRWDFLRGIGETGRHGVLVEYLRRLGPEVSVLDVGCGDGALYEALRPYGSFEYHGIDVAPAPIERARALAAGDARARFEVADGASFTPSRRYDAVVFNESLYYFEEPEAAVARYAAHTLDPEGWLVVSLFRSRRAEAIGRQLRRRFRRLDGVTVSHGDSSWSIAVFAAAPSAERTSAAIAPPSSRSR